MADRIQVQRQVLAAAQYMAQEVLAVYQKLFEWLPGTVDTLFIADVDMSTNQTGAQTTAAATNVLTVEVTSPTAAALGSVVQLYDGAVAVGVLGTTAPLASIHVPAAGRIVLPFFAYESSAHGKAIATQWWLASLTVTSLTAQPAAANRPTARVITAGVA